jgi:hypothetical protein
MREYLLNNTGLNHQILIMRHDIDQNCQYALDLAKEEHRYSIKSTYYFRANAKTYVPGIIDQIASLGHEIGYHYETIDKCDGNIQKAKELFEKQLADFRIRYDVKTVCAHGNPLTKYDNKEIWNFTNLQNYGLIGEAFLCLDFNKFAYFSDSGRTWFNSKSQKMKGKDAVNTAFAHIKPKNTDDLISIIREGSLPNICILTHPERWSRDTIGFIRRYLIDFVFTSGKTVINVYREANGRQ